jgi:HlyD family secretion protein
MRGSSGFWIASALGLAACLQLAGCQRQANSAPSVPAVAAGPSAQATAISALGRLEPKDGIIRIAGPSQPSVVISQLLVDEGEQVRANQLVALLDTVEIEEARVARLQAELENARQELRRHLRLHDDEVISESLKDARELKVSVAEAELRGARAALERARVRSPIDGQVIEVHARAGERVGPEGILELGRTEEMYAVAEVYETDISQVRIGQRATVTSPALANPLTGVVEWIVPKVGKMDLLGTDPAARTDARVVEVEIRLDDSPAAAALTHLQVEVEIET